MFQKILCEILTRVRVTQFVWPANAHRREESYAGEQVRWSELVLPWKVT